MSNVKQLKDASGNAIDPKTSIDALTSTGGGGKFLTTNDLGGVTQTTFTTNDVLRTQTSATPDNFASFDSNGNLQDSNYKAADFVQNITRGGSTLTKTNGVVDIPEEIQNVAATPVAAGGNPTVDLTNGTLTLGIPRGADAVNPFKGWYDADITGEAGSKVVDDTANLPASPTVGDYAYVKTLDIIGAAPSQTETPVVKIYECTTAGTWSDSGRTADTSNVQTFASNQEVNEVHIVKDLTTGGVDDVASAETVKNLKELCDSDLYINPPSQETVNLKSSVVWLEGNNKLGSDGSVIENTSSIIFKTSDFIGFQEDAKKIIYKGGTTMSATNNCYCVAIYDSLGACLNSYFQYPVPEDGLVVDLSSYPTAVKMRICEWNKYITDDDWDIRVLVDVIKTNKESFDDFSDSVDERFEDVEDEFSDVNERIDDIGEEFYIVDESEGEVNLKQQVEWVEGYYYLGSDGNPIPAQSIGRISNFINLPSNTKSIFYKGGVDVDNTHKQVVIYNSNNECLASFYYHPAASGVTYDITSYPTAAKMRIGEWNKYITDDDWDISVVADIRKTNKEAFGEFADWIDSLNQWKGKRFIAFGASNTSGGFDSGTSWIQMAAEMLKMQPPISGMTSRFVSLKYNNGSLERVGLAATVAECQSISASTTISYETQFAKDFDCVLFGDFAGESYNESQVVIDGTTYYGGEELIDLIKLPTTRYNNNPQFTYSNGDTLAQHRDSYIGAVIYVLNELWKIKPTCRVVFTRAYLNWSNYDTFSRNFNGVKKLCDKLHLPFIDLVEGVYFNGFTTGTGVEEDKTNPNIFLWDGQHASLAGRQRLGNIFTHKLLLIS